MRGMTKGRNLRVVVALFVLLSLFVSVSSVRADEPVNFGFETGDLSGWTIVDENDHVGVEGSGAFTSPYWGSYMVVLGQPHLYEGEEGWYQPEGPNTIMQQFTVTSSHLLFAYNFFTFEEPQGPWDQASYIVRVVGSETPIAMMTMGSADIPDAWSGSPSTRTTGWTVVDVDLSAYKGQKIEILFSAGGTLDDEVPSWAYFDGSGAQKPLILMPPAVAFLNQVEGELTSTNPISMIPVRVVPGSSTATTLTLLQGGQVLATSYQSGEFQVPVALADGEYDLTADVVDSNGLRAGAATHLMVDTHAPTVEVAGAGATVHTSKVTIDGVVMDAVSGVRSVAVNGTPVDVFVDGSFSSSMSLKTGTNAVDVEAVDKLGNRSVSTWAYTYQPVALVHPYSVTMVLGKKDVCIDGSWETGAVAPMMYKGKLYLPAAAVMKLTGGTFSYASGKATMQLGGRICTAGLGGNGGTIMGGVYYLPLEYLRDVVGIDLAWDAASHTVSFTRWP